MNLGPPEETVKSIIKDMRDGLQEQVEYKFDQGEVWTWIEKNRVIFGEPWNWDFSEIPLEPTPTDLKYLDLRQNKRGQYFLKKAPRPYLRAYINCHAPVKSCMKCRQCLVGDTVVFIKDENGHLDFDTIENLYNKSYRGSIIYEISGEIHECHVEDIWKSGEKDILEITTWGGQKLKCSTREKVWVESSGGFKLAKYLTKSDILTVYEDSFGETSLGGYLPELIGYMYSDGSYFITGANRKICYFRNTNEMYAQEFSKMVGCHHRVYKHKQKNCSKITHDIYIRKDAPIRKWLDDYNCINIINEHKKLPNVVMSMQKKEVARLLNRLFAGDGYYSKRKRKNYETFIHEIGIGSMSYPMLIQVQTLLSRFGIKSIIKISNGKKSKRKFWKLLISSKKSYVHAFMSEIGIYGKISNDDIENIKREIFGSTIQKSHQRRSEHSEKEPGRIRSIRKSDRENTYDLTISDKSHRFFANGILVSNSEFTEAEINTNLYNVFTFPFFNARHLFPTSSVADQVAKEKIAVAINGSPRLKKRLVKPYNITSKKTDLDSFYTLHGAFNEFGGRGPSSDRNTYDEFNFHNPKIEEIFAATTDHSRYGGQNVFISTPTFPQMGIDTKYEDGSQNRWHFKCHNCNTQQQFVFPDNLINFVEKGQARDREEEDKLLEKVYIGCKHCKAYIDRASDSYLKHARWIARYPDRSKQHESFHVTAFMLAWKTGKEINRKFLRFRFLNQFYNEVLGYSYIGDANRVTKEQVIASQDMGFRNLFVRIPEARNIAVGIDWGEEESWMVAIGDGLGVSQEDKEQMRVLFVFRIAGETLRKYGFDIGPDNHPLLAMKVIDKLKPDIIINDANGLGIPYNAKLYRKYKDKSWAAFYDTTEQRKEKISRSSIQITFNEIKGIVTIPRTVELKVSMETFQDKLVKIPRIETKTMWLFVDHIHSLASSHYYDEKEDKIVQVVGHIGPDHLAHAYTLGRVGFEKIKMESPRAKIKTIKVSGRGKKK